MANGEKTLDWIVWIFKTFSENKTKKPHSEKIHKVRMTKCWRKKEIQFEWIKEYMQNVRHANNNKNNGKNFYPKHSVHTYTLNKYLALFCYWFANLSTILMSVHVCEY